MFQPKYNYRFVLEDLKEHNVDLQKFSNKVLQMSGGTINHSIFEFIYEVLVVNNYNIDLLISKLD